MLNWLITKKKITLLFFFMLVIVGVLTFFQLPQKEIPAIEPPVGQVNTVYPGAEAEEVEASITNPLEQELQDVQEITNVSSVSSPGFSSLTIELEEGLSNRDAVWNDIEQRINDASSQFPDDIETPDINNDLSEQGLSIYQITLDEEALLPEMDRLLENWRRDFTSLPEISDIAVEGALESELLFSLDPEAMEDNNIISSQVIGAINGETAALPPGNWERGNERQRIILETMKDASDFEDLSVGTSEDGDTVQLDNIAEIEDTYQPREKSAAFEGEPALSLTFFLADGASVPTAQERLDPLMDQFEEELPAGAEIEQLYTQGDLVSELFTNLAIAFSISFISVIVVCSVGLNLSTAFSVAIAIPSSLAVGMIVLPYAGVGLDQISLIAFIISLGILVDDAIVVNENIDRRLRQGESAAVASVSGVRQVAASVITSTLTVVFTFLPLLLLPGSSGAFIRPLPTVLISTILASTLVALLIIPIYRAVIEGRKQKRKAVVKENHGRTLLETEEEQQGGLPYPPRSQTGNRKSPGFLGRWIDNAADSYSRRVLGSVVKRPLIVSICGFVIGTAAYGLIPFTPLEFFPDTDREEVFVEASLPAGTLLEESEERARDIEEWFYEHEEVRSVSTYTGTTVPRIFSTGDGPANSEENDINFLIYVNQSEIAAREAMNEWNVTLPQAFPEIEARGSIVESGPPVGAPIAVEVSGESMDSILEEASAIEEIFQDEPGITGTEMDAGNDLSALRFSPEREAMEENGISAEAVSQELRLLGEGVPLGDLQQGSELLDMRLTYQTDGVVEADDLEAVNLRGQGGGVPSSEEDGPPSESSTEPAGSVSLDKLVSEEESASVEAIPHLNGERTVTIRAYPGESGADAVLAETEAELEAIDAQYPENTFSVGGETSERTDVFINIGQIFILVVFLILIVIAVQFYSITMPFVILSAVYLAVAGAVLGLFLTQTGLGFMSMMGAVSLAGIVVRNGIMLIEFIEQRRSAGMPLQEAVILSGKDRFRPIILTSLTSIAGVLPIALGNNPLFQPLGIAIVSGLVFSTILTLVVVPALYTLKVKWKKA
ncbi:efflux RND transporter permease subunit [Alteribacillus sp. HJP-4]|uniref:efflux RND transporter permease subunit n=1 Tax=Alteribacillus sp. HJP-4 TaxID=2775394 RepID=UPI0035CCD017